MDFQSLWPKIVLGLTVVGIGWLALTAVRFAWKFSFIILIVAAVVWFNFTEIKDFVSGIMSITKTP